MAQGGKYQQLEEQEKELSKEVARLKTKSELRLNSVKEAQESVKALRAAVAEVSLLDMPRITGLDRAHS